MRFIGPSHFIFLFNSFNDFTTFALLPEIAVLLCIARDVMVHRFLLGHVLVKLLSNCLDLKGTTVSQSALDSEAIKKGGIQ